MVGFVSYAFSPALIHILGLSKFYFRVYFLPRFFTRNSFLTNSQTIDFQDILLLNC